MSTRKITIAVVAALALALTGCEGTSDEDCESLGQMQDIELAAAVTGKGGGTGGSRGGGGSRTSGGINKSKPNTGGGKSKPGKHKSHDWDDCDDD